MTNPKPLISVIIPVYNGERYLGEAIESVLAQSLHSCEVMIVDDGSTDESRAVALRFAPWVHVVTQANQGASAARNRGVALSSGKFLAFLDADDRWMADKLQLQMLAFTRDPDLAMVFGQVEQFYSPDLATTTSLPDLGNRQTMVGIHIGAMLIQRTAFEHVGAFDSQWQVAHFIEWYGRAQRLGLKSLVLPELVMQRRIHTTNLGVRAHKQARIEYVRLMKAILDQRRLTSSPQPRTESGRLEALAREKVNA